MISGSSIGGKPFIHSFIESALIYIRMNGIEYAAVNAWLQHSVL